MPKTLDSHFSIMSTNRALQPPLPAALRPYEDVMKLLAAFSGPNCEVVLQIFRIQCTPSCVWKTGK